MAATTEQLMESLRRFRAARRQKQAAKYAGYEVVNSSPAPALAHLAYIHEVCEQPAFFMRRVPKKCDLLRSEDAQALNGDDMRNGDLVTCGSCGQRLARLYTGQIRGAA